MNKHTNFSNNPKATWGKDKAARLEDVATNSTYFLMGALRTLLKTGGVLAANLIDIGIGGIVWMIVVSDVQDFLPRWVEFSIGFLISLVMTRAQIWFNEQLFRGQQGLTLKRAAFMTLNFTFSVLDTIIDMSLIVYLLYGASPLEFFVYLQNPPDLMFYVFSAVTGGISLFGDVINLIFIAEQEEPDGTHYPKVPPFVKAQAPRPVYTAPKYQQKQKPFPVPTRKAPLASQGRQFRTALPQKPVVPNTDDIKALLEEARRIDEDYIG